MVGLKGMQPRLSKGTWVLFKKPTEQVEAKLLAVNREAKEVMEFTGHC